MNIVYYQYAAMEIVNGFAVVRFPAFPELGDFSCLQQENVISEAQTALGFHIAQLEAEQGISFDEMPPRFPGGLEYEEKLLPLSIYMPYFRQKLAEGLKQAAGE